MSIENMSICVEIVEFESHVFVWILKKILILFGAG